uniref:Pentatricopeptide repeat-containing protein n=1 Tax=Rhizophora mucronata TaxID=61149 RepID=A0A2P2PRP0_RHIMU
MRCNGMRLDALSYTTMLQWHLNAKDMIGVMTLHADMIKMGVVPNELICNLLRTGYQESGHLKSALRCSDTCSE